MDVVHRADQFLQQHRLADARAADLTSVTQ
jgi:hypothetical protein